MLENIQIQSIPPVIVQQYPKGYSYDDLQKNISYLLKIADRTSNGEIICLSENLDEFKLSFPISLKFYSKYKREELITLNRTDLIQADFYSNSYNDLQEAIANLSTNLSTQGYTAMQPYRIVYKSTQTNFTSQLQIPLLEKTHLP